MPAESFTLLVIEDEPDMLRTLESILGKAGYNVLTAGSGREAQKVFASGAKIDLVLTDLVMPDKDGIELIIDLRRARNSVPVLAMSAWGPKAAGNYLKIAQTFGARGTLEKPFTSAQVLAAVGAVLEPPPVPAAVD